MENVPGQHGVEYFWQIMTGHTPLINCSNFDEYPRTPLIICANVDEYSFQVELIIKSVSQFLSGPARLSPHVVVSDCAECEL